MGLLSIFKKNKVNGDEENNMKGGDGEENMVKKYDEEDTDDDESDELSMDDSELETQEQEITPAEQRERLRRLSQKKSDKVERRGRPSTKHPLKSTPEGRAEFKHSAPKLRYVVFNNPQRIGIMDAETNEIMGEGELAVLHVLADIVERLERIETTIGGILSE